MMDYGKTGSYQEFLSFSKQRSSTKYFVTPFSLVLLFCDFFCSNNHISTDSCLTATLRPTIQNIEIKYQRVQQSPQTTTHKNIKIYLQVTKPGNQFLLGLYRLCNQQNQQWQKTLPQNQIAI